MTDGSHCLLTPKDVREKGFTFSTRRKHDWYDADEVDAFLDLVEQTIKELGRYPALLEMDKQTLQAENTRLLLRLNQKKPRTHAHPKHIRKHHQRHTKHQPQNTSTTNNRKHKP
ncbi:DivIVA domain-containing protein [Bifidobacterium indicum]|uniref:DivIVA domain-containing protein n=1 Tax=Bifidobacterium indicum TaxID=1691 RepID=UPI003BB59FAD